MDKPVRKHWTLWPWNSVRSAEHTIILANNLITNSNVLLRLVKNSKVFTSEEKRTLAEQKASAEQHIKVSKNEIKRAKEYIKYREQLAKYNLLAKNAEEKK